MRKRHSAMLAVLSVLIVGVAALGSSLATAKPPGITEVGKKIANFNVIATPKEWVADDSACPNNGARMFFRRGTNQWTISWLFNPEVHGFKISDCDGTTDKLAVVEQDAGVPVAIFVRVVGPKGSSVDLGCAGNTELTLNGVNSCLLATPTLSKGKTFSRVSEHLFDDELTGILWTLDPSTKFRIAQVDVYELLPA